MLAPSSQIELRTSPAPALGSVTGGVRTLVRLEAAAAFATALTIYAHAGFSWPAFALFFLAPDLVMLAYFIGPCAGAIAYNFAHTYAPALALALAGVLGGVPSGSPISASTGCSATASNTRRDSATPILAASAGAEHVPALRQGETPCAFMPS